MFADIFFLRWSCRRCPQRQDYTIWIVLPGPVRRVYCFVFWLIHFIIINFFFLLFLFLAFYGSECVLYFGLGDCSAARWAAGAVRCLPGSRGSAGGQPPGSQLGAAVLGGRGVCRPRVCCDPARVAAPLARALRVRVSFGQVCRA